MQILELPSDTPINGPSLMANSFSADPAVTQALLPFKQSDATVIHGNLLTLPVGGGLLYVQPVYIRRSAAEGAFPLLQFIIASFGDNVGIGQTLDQALRVSLGLDEVPAVDPQEPSGEGAGGEAPSGGKTANQLLAQASDEYEAAQKALSKGDLATYQKDIDQMADLLLQAQKKLDAK